MLQKAVPILPTINVSDTNGQISVNAGSNIIIINSTKSTVEFSNLPTLKNVNVEVVVSNSTGDSGFSPVASVYTMP